jgi:prefoldin subunit 5
MQNKFSKKLGIIIIALLTISTISVAIPFASATITSRPTIYDGTGATSAPIALEAGTTASINTNGMTITGAQIWLWLSTSGGSEINTALGDRPYAGPFYLADLVDTVSPHTYTFTPATIAGLCNLLSVESPFAGEQKTYSFTLQSGWINGTIPLKVQGEDVDYWIKIADVTPADVIAGSEIGVSTNRVHFLPGFNAVPLSGAPETEVTVSGYALPASEEYNVTQNSVTALGLLTPSLNDDGGWLWTGFEDAFNVVDLENKVVDGNVPPMSDMVNITVWENDTATLMDTWNFTEYYREVYLPKGTFRADTADYSLTYTIDTGKSYVVDMEYFPAYGTVSIYLGNVLVAADQALNATGGFSTSWTVPALTTGNYVFSVIDNNDVAYNFTVHVRMVPYITCTPDTGYVGDTFVVTGVNFLDHVGDYITIYFENDDSSPYYTLMLNFTCPSSTWTSTVLTVPHSMGGENLVEARIVDGTATIADTTYTVLAKIIVDPSVISNNCSLVSIIGTGFEVWDDWTDYRKTYCVNIDNQLMGAAASTTTNFAIVAATSTGDIVVEFVAGGFRPGRHVVALYGDARGSFVNGDIDSYSPAAYTCFWVTTEDDPIVAYLEELNMTMTELDATVMTLDGTIATLSTTVGELQVDLAAVDATVTSISGNVATIKTDVGTIKSSLTTLSASVSSISGGMATVETSLGQVITELSTLDTVIGSMYGDVVALDTSIGSVETSLDALDATVSGLGDDMTAVAGDVVSIDTVLGSVAGTVTSMEGTLATIETNLGTVKVDLASAKTDIAAIETDVNENLPVDMMPVWIAVILSLIAAIGAIAGVFIIQRKIA